MKGLALLSPIRRLALLRGRLGWSRYTFSTHSAVNETPTLNIPVLSLSKEDVALEKWGYCRPHFNYLLQKIEHDKSYQTSLSKDYIDVVSWTEFLNEFRRSSLKTPLSVFTLPELEKLISELPRAVKPDKSTTLISSPQMEELKQLVFEKARNRSLKELTQTVALNRLLSSSTDLRYPFEWFPKARLMKRKIYYHGGPTNSGKTYQALQRLKLADPAKGGGLYCGPLRLLAAELYERLNKEGILTDLITGQEQRYVPGASHISCTVETVNLSKEYDVAVVDEIQMLGDQSRGAVWTRVVLGIQARELHVCGGLEAAELVENFCKSTGDEFELVNYERLSELQVEESSLQGDYSKVQPGDCVVAFSKIDIFAIKKEIESTTKYKCAVIYGQLPPETRSTQARLFNDLSSGYDILVASDAIGMGLNLNIRRIIFHNTLKRIGNDYNTLFISPSAIKQIAGRAGRKSSIYDVGLVTTWQEADLAYVKAVMGFHVPKVTSAGLFPEPAQIESFYDKFVELGNSSSSSSTSSSSSDTPSAPTPPPTAVVKEEKKVITSFTPERFKTFRTQRRGEDRFIASSSSTPPPATEPTTDTPPATTIPVIPIGKVVERFVELSRLDNRFFMVNSDDLITMCNWLHSIPDLSVADRISFASAPIQLRDKSMMHKIYNYASLYSKNRPVYLNLRLPKSLPRNVIEFSDLCLKNNTIELYLWLSMRFPMHFIEKELATILMKEAIELITQTLIHRRLINHEDDAVASGYRELRQKLMTAGHRSNNPIALPPIEYGEVVRQEYLQNYLAIPTHLKYVDPSTVKKLKHSPFKHDHDHDRDHPSNQKKERHYYNNHNNGDFSLVKNRGSYLDRADSEEPSSVGELVDQIELDEDVKLKKVEKENGADEESVTSNCVNSILSTFDNTSDVLTASNGHLPLNQRIYNDKLQKNVNKGRKHTRKISQEKKEKKEVVRSPAFSDNSEKVNELMSSKSPDLVIHSKDKSSQSINNDVIQVEADDKKKKKQRKKSKNAQNVEAAEKVEITSTPSESSNEKSIKIENTDVNKSDVGVGGEKRKDSRKRSSRRKKKKNQEGDQSSSSRSSNGSEKDNTPTHTTSDISL